MDSGHHGETAYDYAGTSGAVHLRRRSLSMKLVTAVIKPFKLDEVARPSRSGCRRHDGDRASGYGRQKGHTEVYRGAEYTSRWSRRSASRSSSTTPTSRRGRTIAGRRTGKIGDGKVWVIPVETVVRVRTGETDEAAL